MLKAVRGIYEEGVARPLEPVDVAGRQEVIITFVNGEPRSHQGFLAAAGSWADVDAEALKTAIYAQRSVNQRPQPRL